MDPNLLERSMSAQAAHMSSRLDQRLRNHHGELGAVHENTLRDVLRVFLPRRFEMSQGEVVAASGEVSSQHDVLIWDSLTTPLLDRSGDHVVIPYEGCLAVIEVSTRLNAVKLREDAEKIRRLKSLAPTEAPRPSGFLFGYESVGLKGLQTGMEELAGRTAVAHRVDSVYSLNHGIITNFKIVAGGATYVSARARDGYAPRRFGVEREQELGWVLTTAALSIYAALREQIRERGDEPLSMSGWGVPG